MEQFIACFKGLDDPRTGNAALHDFHELLLIALCTVLCGGQSAVDMALFAQAKERFLRGFLKLENGLPSHDTFGRLFRLLDPISCSRCCASKAPSSPPMHSTASAKFQADRRSGRRLRAGAERQPGHAA